jgi:hypothetical protein
MSDGRIVSGSWDKTIRVWNMESLQVDDVLEYTKSRWNTLTSKASSSEASMEEIYGYGIPDIAASGSVACDPGMIAVAVPPPTGSIMVFKACSQFTDPGWDSIQSIVQENRSQFTDPGWDSIHSNVQENKQPRKKYSRGGLNTCGLS